MKYHITLLAFITCNLMVVGQVKCRISCPVEAELLKEAKVRSIKIEKEELNSKKKEVVSVFKIGDSGCPYEETYLPFNITSKNWMKRTYERISNREFLFTISVIDENSELKTLQKTLEVYDAVGALIKKIHTAYSGVEEITIEQFKPEQKYYLYKVMYKVLNGDTLQIISNIRENNEQKYFIRNFKDGKWYENERSYTKYNDKNEPQYYQLYRDKKLVREWSPGDDKGDVNDELDIRENPLPVPNRKPVIDTLYIKSPTDTNYSTKPISKGYMLLKRHNEYGYSKNPIISERMYYPNGLIYSHWNTAEKTRLLYTYEYK